MRITPSILASALSASRQIDVLITHTEGPYTYETLVECKFWNKKIERQHLDVVAMAIRELNAAKGVIFTTKGYQAGAKQLAASLGIRIFVVRDLLEEEWGRPGRVIDFYIQMWARTVLNIEFPKACLLKVPANSTAASIRPRLELSDKPTTWRTPTRKMSGEPWKPLEQVIYDSSLEALRRITSDNATLFNGGVNGTWYMQQSIVLNLPDGCIVDGPQGLFMFDLAHLELAYRIHQWRFVRDRGEAFDYALAVVDCVNDQRHVVSRRVGTAEGAWQPLSSSEPDPDAFQNGSVMRVAMSPYFDPNEMPKGES